MGLREEFEQQGEWLFRWRSYVPLVFLPLGALAVLTLSHNTGPALLWSHILYKTICIMISGAGLLVRCLTIGYVPRGTSGRNTRCQRAESLNTTGIYSLVRHPLYLGNYLIFLGIVMFVPVVWFAVVFSLLYWLYYERIMFREEEFIRGLYGESFVVWSKNTPAFIPRFHGYVAPGLSFSLKNVLKREYSAFYAMVTIFTLLEHAITWRISGIPVIEKWWLISWAFGTIVYVVLRSFKKYTHILAVDGR